MKRIRFTSPHPKDFKDNTLRSVNKLDKVTNQIHIPLQSGSDTVLRKMQRGYNKKKFLEKVDLAKNTIKDVSLTTDVIVGFPGETEQDFEETLSVLRYSKFDAVYMFQFSSRPGTKASEYEDDFIKKEVINERFMRLKDMQTEISHDRYKRFVGTEQTLLVENLSLDSMAVYKGLDILTAKPTDVMRSEVLYYGLDIADTDQNFSVVDYLNYLIDKNIPELSFEQDILVVGGTGLYYKSIIDSFEFRPTDPAIRAELEQLNYDQLLKFHELHEIQLPKTELNKRRLIRNIEDNILEQSKYIFPPINVKKGTVGIFWNNPNYKENIRKRTNEMIEQGLVSEINNIKNPSKTILQAIGMNIDKDIEENINIKTMKLAKKQITWFKKEPRLKMIESVDESMIYESMMEMINE